MMSKLWPARTKHQGPIVDLDKIVSEPCYFRFNGKIWKVNPVKLEAFLKFSNAQQVLLKMVNDKETVMPWRDVAQVYVDVISPLCPQITIDHIMEMQQVQVAALYQLIISVVSGDVDDGDDKKKRLKIPIHESVRPSS